jgi:hypothetical protein
MNGATITGGGFVLNPGSSYEVYWQSNKEIQ